ncbi:lipopolysaccharide biosynthesis protein [Kluyvera huaxiensis]|uniref:lipopolysaccharide biosynthesis protein n=1 Tax=Kluyvera sp. 142053 TaxID=3160979 RepID=UPI0032DED319
MNKSIIIGLLVLFMERGTQIISAIYANHLISRHLTIEQFGVWQYAFTFSNVLMTLSWMCGSESVVPKLTGYSLREKLSYCNVIFFTRIFVSFFATLITLVAAFTVDSEVVKYYLLITSISILVREPLMIGFAKWQSEGKLYYSGAIQIIGCGVRIATLYLIVTAYGVNEKLLAVPWVLEGVLVGLCIYCCSIGKIPSVKSFNYADIKQLLKRSFFIWGGVVAYAIFIKLDRILLKEYLNADIYGIYSAASQLNENTASVTLILIQVIAPLLLYKHNKWSEYNKNLIRLCTAMAGFFILLSISIMPFSQSIFNFVFGHEYEMSAKYYNMLIFLLPLYAIDNMINAANLISKSYYYYSIKWAVIFIFCISVFLTLNNTFKNLAIINMYISLSTSLLLSVSISIYWYLTVTKKHMMDNKND